VVKLLTGFTYTKSHWQCHISFPVMAVVEPNRSPPLQGDCALAVRHAQNDQANWGRG
jgi:hypothetical protein